NATGVPAEDGMMLMMSFERRAPGTRCALVAWPRNRQLGTEVFAARFLQQIAAQGGAIAHLGRSRPQRRLGQHRHALTDEAARFDIGKRRERTDVKLFTDLSNGCEIADARKVDDLLGCRNTQSHPIEDLRSAGEEGRVSASGQLYRLPG